MRVDPPGRDGHAEDARLDALASNRWDEGLDALAQGRWQEAVTALSTAAAEPVSEAIHCHALEGLSDALWWIGRVEEAVAAREQAYEGWRTLGDDAASARAAAWLAREYRASLGNAAASRGWLRRAETLSRDGSAVEVLGWVDLTKAVLAIDPSDRVAAGRQALEAARASRSGELEVLALGQVGLGTVAAGQVDEGLACLDEAMAAATGGDAGLATLAALCCDLVVASELSGELDRFAHCRPRRAAPVAQGRAMTFDVVIRGARVVPGDAPPAVADVCITGDRIDAVEPSLAASVAGEVIDGAGRLLCPGFIDLHAHSALEPFEDPTLFPKIAQGFTTELISPVGLAPAPVAPDGGLQRRRYLAPLEGSGLREWTWSTIEEYALALDATGPVGKSLADIAEERRSGPVTAFLDLLVDTDLQVAMIDHYATEETVRAIFQHPLGLVGPDGIFSERPHPRLYGTAARVLGRYAIREKLVTPNEAVARLTARAADRIGLTDRGRIRPGLRADLVLIDPERFVDRATYEDPCQAPDGVVRVWVAGRTVLRDGAPTGERHGGVLRSPPAP